MTITLQSSAFEAGQVIPKKYTGDGPDVSPPLTWSGLPEGTKEVALIVDDPDAPTSEPWVHWVIYKIPANVNSLPEGVPKSATLSDPADALQGITSFRKVGYGGPLPPAGHGPHRYYFKIYALDASLDLGPGIDKKALLKAMSPHIIAEGELMGTYQR